MSLTRPTNLPLFATDATFTTGAESGTNTKTDPGSTLLARGHYPGLPTLARHQNFWQWLAGEWVEFLDSQRAVVSGALVRNGLGHAAYEGAAGVPIPLRGACQFPVPASSSSNRIHSPAGWAAGPVVPTFATATASLWSGAVDQANARALIAMTSTSSIATRLCRFNAGAWATADLPVAYLGAARAAFIGANFFVAQANAAIYQSTTGATGSWSAATALPANTDYRHLDYTATNGTVTIGCRSIADTPNAYVLRTANGGTTWSAVLVPGSDPYVQGVAWDASRSQFVAVGATSASTSAVPAVWVSTDGASWTALTVTFSYSVADTLADVVCVRGTLVTLSQSTGIIHTSSDGGSTWTALSASAMGATYATVDNGTDLLMSSGTAHTIARF